MLLPLLPLLPGAEGGWLREEELGPVGVGPPPGWSRGAGSVWRTAGGGGRRPRQGGGVCIYIFTVC